MLTAVLLRTKDAERGAGMQTAAHGGTAQEPQAGEPVDQRAEGGGQPRRAPDCGQVDAMEAQG